MTLTEKQQLWHGVHWSRWHWPDRSRENSLPHRKISFSPAGSRQH